MSAVKVTVAYRYENLPKFAEMLNNIVKKMEGNDNFPARHEQVEELAKDQTAYLELWAKSLKGGEEAATKRDNMREEICIKLDKLGLNITSDCNGSLDAIITSGFPYNKVRTPAPPFKKPGTPKVKATNANGEIQAEAEKQGATQVKFLITDDPEGLTGWRGETVSKSKYIFTGLESGKQYWIKYILYGTRNRQIESPAISYRPQ